MDVKALQEVKEDLERAVHSVRERGLVANSDERPEFALQTVLGAVPHLPGMIKRRVPKVPTIFTPAAVEELLRDFAIDVMKEQIGVYVRREEASPNQRRRARSF